jgi:hypothetical protein
MEDASRVSRESVRDLRLGGWPPGSYPEGLTQTVLVWSLLQLVALGDLLQLVASTLAHLRVVLTLAQLSAEGLTSHPTPLPRTHNSQGADVCLRSSGVRRCDGTAKAVADKILNKPRRDGTRTFNANVFSCQHAMPDRLEETVCKDATKWLRKPWLLQESSDWGRNAAESNSRAFKQMQWIEGLGRICCGEPPKVLDIETRKPLRDRSDSGEGEEELDVRPLRPHQPLHSPPPPPRSRRSMAPQPTPKAMPVLRSRSPVGGKPDGKSRHGQPTPKTKPSRDKHRREPTPPRKEPSSSRHAASSAHSRGGTEGEVTCPRCDGRGSIADTVEPWMAVDANPRMWASILEKHGADQYAMSDWFALAAHADGRTAALRLLHNVLKKSSGGHEIQNASGFLVRGIRNAWHDIVT